MRPQDMGNDKRGAFEREVPARSVGTREQGKGERNIASDLNEEVVSVVAATVAERAEDLVAP